INDRRDDAFGRSVGSWLVGPRGSLRRRGLLLLGFLYGLEVLEELVKVGDVPNDGQARKHVSGRPIRDVCSQHAHERGRLRGFRVEEEGWTAADAVDGDAVYQVCQLVLQPRADPAAEEAEVRAGDGRVTEPADVVAYLHVFLRRRQRERLGREGELADGHDDGCRALLA